MIKNHDSISRRKVLKLIGQARLMTPKRIKSIRKSYNLTQVNFADLLDVSYNTYKNWEIGHRNPCTSAVSLLTLAEQDPGLFFKRKKAICLNPQNRDA